MILPVQRLVGRASELNSVEQALKDLDMDRPSAIELAGEPGIGKTRLLRELAASAEARGYLVLFGSACEIEHDVPFSVFVDALDEYVASLYPERLAHLEDHVRAELAHIFPSLGSPATGHTLALQEERYRTHRAIRSLLENLADRKPLVLLLDDFHWADPASVELLDFLLRHPPTAAVLTAVALRPRQITGRLTFALDRAHRSGTLARVELAPLTLDEARELLSGSVDSVQASLLYEESGGIPFYLEQLARSLDRAGALRASGDLLIDLEVPSAVASSLQEELALLSAPVRLVLEGASVVGDPFEPELAAATAGTSEDSTMDAIDLLLQRDLIRPTDVPRRFRFRHPLVRRAVYENIGGGWRLGAHKRCAEALAARGARAATRAHHVERSARQGDLAAVAILREAGEAAARLAPSSAARWFRAALRLLPETAPSNERVALLVSLARSLAAAGQIAESRAHLLDCLDIAARDAKDWRVRVTTACASVEHLLGLQKDARSHLATALAELKEPESTDAVELMIELSVNGYNAGDFDAMYAWAARAVAGAMPLGDRSLLAAALAARAWAATHACAGEQAQAHCDQATDLVDELSDEELSRRLDSLSYLTTAEQYLDRFKATTRHGQRALQIGRATGQGEQFPRVVAMLGGALWIQGRVIEAGDLFDGAVETARLAGNVRSLAWMLFNRSLAALAGGDLDIALMTGEESFELMEAMEPGPSSAFASAALASALLEKGEAGRSVDLLLTRAGGETLPWIGAGWRARFLELLTRGLLAIGRRADAQRAVAAARACADEVGLPSATAMANLAAAALAIDADEPAIAAERVITAVAALESVSAWFDAARARVVAGRAFALAGNRNRASFELELAATAFDSFGSFRYRNETERELRKLGRHIHRRTRPGTPAESGIKALTARELEIARLVVDRRTNAEIAAELFLSQKTVETHLHNIFNKVGIETRVALARAVEHVDQEGARPR